MSTSDKGADAWRTVPDAMPHDCAALSIDAATADPVKRAIIGAAVASLIQCRGGDGLATRRVLAAVRDLHAGDADLRALIRRFD